MKDEGPSLVELTHRLSECPLEFLDITAVDLGAVMCDHFRAMKVDRPEEFLAAVLPDLDQLDPHFQQVMLIAIWLLHDEWFLERPELARRMRRLLGSPLKRLAETVDARLTVTDADRREELVRICLKALDLRPCGETPEQAQDRLKALDSVERARVLKETRAAEARARQIRQRMAEQAAREAAARYSPE